MRVAVQIPIKGRSERVPGKNLRVVAGKPLFGHLLDRLCSDAPEDWSIVVDTDSDAVQAAIEARYKGRFPIHRRDAWYGSNDANGNHLLAQFAHAYPGAEIYVQAFVTAPRLRVESIIRLVAWLEKSPDHDSATFVVPAVGWYWRGDTPLNYDPDRMDGLPRSQDAPIYRETTGAYAVRREALLRTGCRLPAPRMLLSIDRSEAADIDTPEDIAAL